MDWEHEEERGIPGFKLKINDLMCGESEQKLTTVRGHFRQSKSFMNLNII